jgi:hypothetical protein
MVATLATPPNFNLMIWDKVYRACIYRGCTVFLLREITMLYVARRCPKGRVAAKGGGIAPSGC